MTILARRLGKLVRYVVSSGHWLVWMMCLLISLYTVALVSPGSESSPLVDVRLTIVTKLSLVAVAWTAAVRTGFDRREIVFSASAITLVVAADSYAYFRPGASDQSQTLPDIGYFIFYVLIVAAIVSLVRRQIRPPSRAVLLEGAIGILGAASVLAALLTPILDAVGTTIEAGATAVVVTYPLFNAMLVLVIAGTAATQGPDPRRRWMLLVLGLMIFSATEIVYLRIGDAYVSGTSLDAGWAIGLALIAVWIDASSRRTGTHSHSHTQGSVAAVAVPILSTGAGLGVLILASQVAVTGFAIGLAASALALASLPLVSRQIVLRRQARTDDLTGLPNRRALYGDVTARITREPLRRRALLLLDLDRFKEVNDSLGHSAGDRLLVQAGIRLSDQLREHDLLARLGGDEFAILLDDVGHAEAVDLAIRLRAALAVPFTLEGIALQTGVSVGIALYPDQGSDLTGLMRKADMAMYKAKSTRSGHHVYRSNDDSHGDLRLRTLSELRLALQEDQLVVHYQPKIDLASGSVAGVEALVRWQHPTRGLLFPDQFLVLIEEAGLMHALTERVLTIALDQAKVWSASGTADPPLSIAVNLSASSLVDAELPEKVGGLLADRDLPGTVLELEITEDFLLSDRDRARDILDRLRAHDIRISIDDFGTGYSSLAYLRDLPIDELKLDQSFVFPLKDDPRAAALVKSSIELAHGLGLRMVAEGVENAATYDALAGFGCDQAQGYFISRPIPADAFDRWLADRRQRAQPVDRPGPQLVGRPGPL
jgi:diguanylate cyclase (GGDEF)-like protein